MVFKTFSFQSWQNAFEKRLPSDNEQFQDIILVEHKLSEENLILNISNQNINYDSLFHIKIIQKIFSLLQNLLQSTLIKTKERNLNNIIQQIKNLQIKKKSQLIYKNLTENKKQKSNRKIIHQKEKEIIIKENKL
ncbi:hypothetical protein TTHERM_000760319 (macronuclear) [Tetrahymena thermophila SB210]|uniref:Uncharacterized protein n=1 Tax=Tetrahymena thermophila (strain SB210) TaxID=312017 RepID=W7XFX7_TETTS|nr:hypothetical protein TTHERM_000760319 [Tetrahymena thermophila SB210]EWS71739.1 hypothetical protein TTHERM_000760319 [Tetrahymena thermophila SB210]|eukprot:XP_012655725.1 hypothetical protein TTHERM_000760319 [Tetrahymena thermophila SB210]